MNYYLKKHLQIFYCAFTQRMYSQASGIKKESRHLYLTISLQVIIQEPIDIIAGYKMNSRKCCYY